MFLVTVQASILVKADSESEALKFLDLEDGEIEDILAVEQIEE